MQSDRQAVIDGILNRPGSFQVFRAVVESIEPNNTCTVRLLNSDLVVDLVSLVAEEDAAEWIKVSPRIGSIVLVGCVENEVADLYLVQPGEIDGGEISVGETRISWDKESVNLVNASSSIALNQNSASITQDTIKIELLGGKVDISNGSASLKDLFDDLGSLLQNFKVVTAQGPSTALFPDTLTAVTAFKTKYLLLLK